MQKIGTIMKERLLVLPYTVDDETEVIRGLLKAAINEGNNTGKYLYPYSYWTDSKGWLYLKWIRKDAASKTVVRYKFDDKDSLINEEIPIKLNAKERLRGVNSDDSVVLITGDTHRDFKRIIHFCERYPTTQDDVLIILGDAGINLFNDKRDIWVKDRLSRLPITLFCIYGNHEIRPANIPSYKLVSWRGGLAYKEGKYPNLIFAKDGEVYDIAGKKNIVIGGAYSVDKWIRLKNGYGWFEDEQPSEEIKKFVEKQLDNLDWSVDVVLSHTTPYQYRPVDKFLDSVDQSTVDSSTERWLSDIEMKLSYEKWYCGHYHCDRTTDKLQIMFKNVELFCGDRELGFSME